MRTASARLASAAPALRLAPPPAWLLPAATVALAAFLVIAFSGALFGCGDTSWHLAAGDRILALRSVPRTDPFSFTFVGRPWVAHEWLAEAIMAASFALGAWSLLALLFAVAIAAVLLTIGSCLGHHLPPLAVAATLALVAAALAPSALARPHLLGWLLLAAWLAILLHARDAGHAPPLAAALLMLVWANLHASFLFGLAIAGALAAEALFARARPAVLRGWAGFGLLALAMALATPHGIDGLLFPVRLSAMTTLPLITEWRPTDFADQPAFAMLLAAGGYLLARHRVAVPPLRALIVLATLAMALAHARHQAIFAIVAPMLLAPALGAALAKPLPARRSWWPLLALLACAIVAAGVRLAHPAVEHEAATNPVAMLDALPPALLRRPVLNGYAFGGPLIRRGIPVFIDGRADMYGDSFMLEYDRIERADMPAFRRAVARHQIGWTILPPDTRLAHALDREPGWRLYARDQWAVVHVRTN